MLKLLLILRAEVVWSKKLLAQETELRADIKLAEGLLQEGNDKLVLAIKAKDMSQISLAQAMIEA